MTHDLPSKKKFALILWEDPHSLPATQVVRDDDLGELHKSLPMVSAGWVLKDDNEGVSIASEYCGGGEYRNTTHVHRKLIVEVRYVRLPGVVRSRGKILGPLANAIGPPPPK
jgi:hypothetical protein